MIFTYKVQGLVARVKAGARLAGGVVQQTARKDNGDGTTMRNSHSCSESCTAKTMLSQAQGRSAPRVLDLAEGSLRGGNRAPNNPWPGAGSGSSSPPPVTHDSRPPRGALCLCILCFLRHCAACNVNQKPESEASAVLLIEGGIIHRLIINYDIFV